MGLNNFTFVNSKYILFIIKSKDILMVTVIVIFGFANIKYQHNLRKCNKFAENNTESNSTKLDNS